MTLPASKWYLFIIFCLRNFKANDLSQVKHSFEVKKQDFQAN